VKARFRPWQLAIALIALCGLAIVAVRYWRRPIPVSASEMMTYLPKRDNAAYTFFDVKALRDSGILDKIAGSTVSEENDYKSFVADTGFDYRTDLDGVLVESAGDHQFAVVAARYDWRTISRYVANRSGQCKGGFCRVPASQPNRTVSIYPIQSNMLAIAIGPDEWAASNIKPKSQGAPPPGMYPADPIWMALPATTFKDPSNLPTGTRQFAKALDGTDGAVLSLTPAQSRFDLTLDATCKNEEAAVVLRSQLEAITNLLKRIIEKGGQKPNLADLSGVLTSGTFQRVSRHVIGKWPLERSFLDSLGGS
jgi:hypothetical protein